MATYQQGETAAFGQLVSRYASPLLGYLVRLTGDHGAAEDLFQETFQRVAARAASFDPARTFKPWLYGIASHLATDRFRRTSRQPAAEELPDHLESPHPGPADCAIATDRRALVLAALDSLAPGQRQVVVLVYYQGLTHREAADALGVSIGTVKQQMSRAMAALAQRLPAGGVV